MTEAAKWFQDMTARHEQDPKYWAEGLKLEFAEQVGRLLEERKMTRAELARRLGTSPAYVTKILHWTANLTLESMAKIALALDARVTLELAPRDIALRSGRVQVRAREARRSEARQEFVVCDKPRHRSAISSGRPKRLP